MKILVYGAGAIGSAIGERLSKAHEVTLMTRRPHAEAIGANGLLVCDNQDRRRVRVPCVTSLEDLETQDVVLITTKAYDTKDACDQVAKIADNKTIVASIQNGLGNYEHLSRRFGRHGVAGITSMGVTMVRPGEIRLAGAGPTLFGPFGDDAETLTNIFKESGLEAQTSQRIFADIWKKAVINAAINPLTVIAGRSNGCILHEPYMSLAKEACQEAAAVAEAEGVVLNDPWQLVQEVVERTSYNKSSMLQDVERGKKTEIRQITGEIVRRAGGLGIAVPINSALLELLLSMGRQEKKPQN